MYEDIYILFIKMYLKVIFLRFNFNVEINYFKY